MARCKREKDGVPTREGKKQWYRYAWRKKTEAKILQAPHFFSYATLGTGDMYVHSWGVGKLASANNRADRWRQGAIEIPRFSEAGPMMALLGQAKPHWWIRVDDDREQPSPAGPALSISFAAIAPEMHHAYPHVFL